MNVRLSTLFDSFDFSIPSYSYLMKKVSRKVSVADKVDKDKLLRARNLIVAVYVSQFKRRCFILLMRAFTKWSREYTLYLKCDELAKQLKERTFGLEEVRKAYLRDVVNVKIYLEKISNMDIVEVDKYNYLNALAKSGISKISANDDEFELSPYQQQQRQIQEQQIRQLKLQQADIKKEIVGVDSMPGVDLRSLIRRAVDSQKDTSAMLRDNLIEAGVLDIEKMRTLNPWEQSSAYTRHMKIKRGHFFSLPEPGGESIPLLAPSKHRLFVKYCSDCIGIIQLVRSWNSEVEDALRFRIEYGIMDQQLLELRKLIGNLNVIIEDQEKALNKEIAKNKELEEANAWFHNWTDTKKVDSLGNELRDMKKVLAENMNMARADVESTKMNVTLSLKSRISSALSAEETLYKVIRKEKLAKETEVKARLQMYEDLRQCQVELANAAKENASIVELRDKEAEKNAQLQRQLTAMSDTVVALERACLFKDNVYNELRAESIYKIDFLKKQIGDMSTRCTELEKVVASSREEVGNLKMENRHMSTSLEFFAAQKEAAILREARLEAYYSKKRKRLTVRIIAHLVRAIVRIIRSFRRRDLASLGMLGYRMMVRQLERKEMRTKLIVDSLREKNAELEIYRQTKTEQPRFTRGASLNEQEMGTVLKKFMRSSFTMNLGVGMEEISEEQFESIVNSRHYDRFTEDIINKFSNNILKTKILVQMQRNLAHQIAGAVFSSRAIIANLDIDQEIANLKSTVPSVAQVKPVVDKDSKLKPIGRVKELKKKFTSKSNTLIRWVKTNKKKSSRLLPFKIPFDIVEEIKRVPKGRLRATRNQFTFKIESLLTSDREQAAYIGEVLYSDVRKVENYIALLKQKIEKLTEENREALAQKLKWESEDDLYSNAGSKGANYDFLNRQKEKREKTSQEKLLGLKSNLIHLLDDPNGVSRYMASLVKAIESVQEEEDDLKMAEEEKRKQDPNYDDDKKKKKKKKKSGKEVSDNDTLGSDLSSIKSPNPAPAPRKKTLLLDKIVPMQRTSVEGKKKSPVNLSRTLLQSDHSENAIADPNNNFSSESKAGIATEDGRRSYGSESRRSGTPLVKTAILTGSTVRRKGKERRINDASMSSHGQLDEFHTASLSAPSMSQSSGHSERRRNAKMVDKSVGTTDEAFLDIYSDSSIIMGGEDSFHNIEIYTGLADQQQPEYRDDRSNIDSITHDSAIDVVNKFSSGGGVTAQKEREREEEEEDDDDDDEDDDEKRDYSPLEIAKLEATAILRHEQRLARQIKAQQRENQYLLADLQVMTNKLAEYKLKYKQSTLEQEQIVYDVSKLSKEFEAVQRQNEILREIVEESYKKQAAAVEKVLEEKNHEIEEREKQRQAKYADSVTQIACVVCAKREHLRTSDPYDDDATVPLVHESLAQALEGEVVLVAKPRHINGLLSMSHPYRNRVVVGDLPEMKASLGHSPVEQKQHRPTSADRPASATSVRGEKGRMVNIPSIRAAIDSPSSRGSAPRPVSAYAGSKSAASLPQLLSNGHSSHSPGIELSKLTRPNQTTRKTTSPDGSNKRFPKSKTPSRDRTLSNTAAYLQGKILADSNYISAMHINLHPEDTSDPPLLITNESLSLPVSVREPPSLEQTAEGVNNNLET